jgi:hypothetical protein
MEIKTNEQVDNFKADRGIGLFKIRYEMDVKNSIREQGYMAGVIAYSSKEAVDTLINFAKKNVKGFKGMKIDEVSYDGACHAMSDTVKNAVIKGAVKEGIVVRKEEYQAALESSVKEAKKTNVGKKSIIPKD